MNTVNIGDFSDPAVAEAHFATKLSHETDVADVRAAQRAREPFVLIDSRSEASWNRGHLPGALHMPTSTISDRAPSEIPLGTPVVVYCWGPACNGSTRAALQFARLGYRVKEMIGGYEYWVREGFATEADGVKILNDIDPLTAPTTARAEVVG